MRMYQVAPAGTPIGLADLAGCLLDQLRQRDALEAFRTSIRSRYGSRYCLFVSTGRAALALILQAMRELAPGDRDEVIIPSYTCYSVPAAVARAGLKVRICDIDAETLDYDHAALERADFSRVLCVASANLYGIPNDLPRLRAIAGSRGAFVLDDAAQSMDARVNGEFSGTLGDVGIFSLDKGKNITTIDGGIIVTDREDLGALLQAKVAALPQPSAATRLVYFAKLIAYSIFLHPRLYWMPDSAPFLKLGTTMYPHDLAIEAYPEFLASVGDRLFRRIEELTSARIENARYLLGKLHDLEAVQLVSILAAGPLRSSCDCRSLCKGTNEIEPSPCCARPESEPAARFRPASPTSPVSTPGLFRGGVGLGSRPMGGGAHPDPAHASVRKQRDRWIGRLQC